MTTEPRDTSTTNSNETADVPYVYVARGEPDVFRLAGLAGRVVTDAADTLEDLAEALLDEDIDLISIAAERASSALTEVVRMTPDDRDALAERAALQHAQVIAVEWDGPPKDIVIYDEYFRIRRVTLATTLEVAVGAAPLLESLARCLPSLALSFDDRAALAVAASAILKGGVYTSDLATAVRVRKPITEQVTLAPEDPSRRWIRGHQMYGLMNRGAAAQIIRARDLIAAGNADEAAGALTVAQLHVRALTASMEMAAALSARSYISVRDSMRYPQLDIDLSGSQNLDHRAYRRALKLLLEHPVAGAGHDEIESAAFADARDRLLHLDLADLGRHIELTFRLVGHGAALDEFEGGSAVQSLRAMNIRRLAAYSPLMRNGDITGGAF
jgi:hypothetical protein